MAVAKIEVSTERPAEIAMPQAYLGDSQLVTSRPNAVTALATSPWAPLAAVSSFRQIAIYNTSTLELLGVLHPELGQGLVRRHLAGDAARILALHRRRHVLRGAVVAAP